MSIFGRLRRLFTGKVTVRSDSVRVVRKPGNFRLWFRKYGGWLLLGVLVVLATAGIIWLIRHLPDFHIEFISVPDTIGEIVRINACVVGIDGTRYYSEDCMTEVPVLLLMAVCLLVGFTAGYVYRTIRYKRKGESSA